MTERAHGPGIRWLAGRAGCTPEDLLADPGRLARALMDATRAATELGAALSSTDDARRAQAESEAARWRAAFSSGSDPGDVLRATLARALRDAADRLHPPERADPS